MVSVVIGVSLLLGLIGVGRLLNVYSDTSLSELLYLAPVVVILVQGRFEILRGMKLKPVNILTILWTMLFAALLVPLCILLNLLYCACLPALVEEYLFRGVFYQYFRPYGLLKTALVTGLMFGLAHLNLNQFLYAFAIGIFFTFLKDASGSLFACMLAHTVVNGLNVLAQYIIRSTERNRERERPEPDLLDSSYRCRDGRRHTRHYRDAADRENLRQREGFL